MASLTEQLTEDGARSTKETAKETVKTLNKAQKELRKGIALILNSTVFSEDSIMQALDKKVERTENLDFSYSKLEMSELIKRGRVEKVDEPLIKDSMKYFDRYCRKYNVKYSAIKSTQKDTSGKEREEYIIFFEGKDDKVIENIIKQAVADWSKNHFKNKGRDSERENGAEDERTSLLAKLSFFRSRVKEFVGKEAGKEATKQTEVER